MSDSEKNLENLMKRNFSYPDPVDKNFQSKIYKKREFYYNKLPNRDKLETYDDIKEVREEACSGKFSMREYQLFLSNFINPDTPYRGVLIYHGTGSGKTASAIGIAEKFKDMVQKYNTKIFILVNGPIIKENWKRELINATGETYLKIKDKGAYIPDNEMKKARKEALVEAMQYYRFISYRSFYRKVIGEKIAETTIGDDQKTKKKYRKTEDGDYERDISVDRIYDLDNSLIIVDEAHNLTGNAYGEALKKIIKNSKNLKVVLLTATPMKNLADDIIELINFIRPPEFPMTRDKIFTNEKNYEMAFKEGGIEYLKNMSRGYVSHLRGADPLTFAKMIEIGNIPKGLQFTKLTTCKMKPWQKKVYESVTIGSDDSLDRSSEAVANFVFPALSENRKELIGVHGNEGLQLVMSQIKNNLDTLNKRIALDILKDKDLEGSSDLIYMSDITKNITGKILHEKYLENFSSKFHRALLNLNKLFWGNKGPRIGFCYSNLVKVGVEIFQEILIQNGYLEYQEVAGAYIINPETRCYYCGKRFDEHKRTVTQSRASEGSQVLYKLKRTESKNNPPPHEFHPATFVTVTGKSQDEGIDVIPEDKHRILTEVYNHPDNIEGKNIKFVLGSKVMHEGISLKHVSEVHILDVYYNLGKVEQVKGRGIRHCSHYRFMTRENPYPSVNVYKYAIDLDKGMSSEIDLYRKAEFKHLLVKKVERAIKEVAVDCPLNRAGNIFPEELEEYKDCGKEGKPFCPSKCDYMECTYKCDDEILNSKYYDPTRNIYKSIEKEKLDYSTFTHKLAKDEIDYAKDRIKELFKLKYANVLDAIVEYVKNSYNKEKRMLFDPFFVYKALDEMIPVTENDFNNFTDTILDKYNRSGYLIFVNKYYIFQPFDQNEDVPMYYRTNFNKTIVSKLSIGNYLQNMEEYKIFRGTNDIDESDEDDGTTTYYDFESTLEYYDERPDNKYVGIIDKEASRRKSKRLEDLKDVFKLREKRSKVLEKKRGTGIPSLKGAVCETSKDKDYLENVAKTLKIKLTGKEKRSEICAKIKQQLLFLEKYSEGKDNKTYMMIPANHSKFPFPYNLDDRLSFLKKKLNKNIKFKLDINIKKKKDKDGLKFYELSFKNSSKLNDNVEFFKENGGKLVGKNWLFILG
ncbi:MAG: hypothetical protein CMF62_02715 [Magnetococcales bacterium]|nr:hypothetical protein [Magnetococcales bacterium]|tara:strand:+ start:44184 stop:47609 length:3426 start_codon:yes stop_codon:yes gene_type:complete